MLKIFRTDSSHPDFISLVQKLDADLAERDGDDNTFYAQFNKIVEIKFAVVAYDTEQPVSCGAIRVFKPGVMEVKRMYTLPGMRGKGFASQVLLELEKWAAVLGYARCILETGLRQPEAIALYEKNGYSRIPNYGPYAGVYNSVCFEKLLSSK